MAIDNPLDQALAQIEAEKRDTNPAIEHLVVARPFLRFMAAAAAALKVGNVGEAVSALKALADSFSRDRSEYLFGVVISELRVLSERFEHLDQAHQEYLDRDWPALFLDADKKARETRGREKIERIGRVVSGAAYSPRPPDETEEFMRIAMSLDDRDVQVLKIICDLQGKMIRPETGRVRSYDAYSSWGVVCSGARSSGILQGELDSICGKLESFGLITRGEKHTNLIGDEPTPFALLLRGGAFLETVEFSSPSPGLAV
jgi:hypothetical protein